MSSLQDLQVAGTPTARHADNLQAGWQQPPSHPGEESVSVNVLRSLWRPAKFQKSHGVRKDPASQLMRLQRRLSLKNVHRTEVVRARLLELLLSGSDHLHRSSNQVLACPIASHCHVASFFGRKPGRLEPTRHQRWTGPGLGRIFLQAIYMIKAYNSQTLLFLCPSCPPPADAALAGELL